MAICKKCGNKFIKKGKYNKLCINCIGRTWKSRVSITPYKISGTKKEKKIISLKEILKKNG